MQFTPPVQQHTTTTSRSDSGPNPSSMWRRSQSSTQSTDYHPQYPTQIQPQETRSTSATATAGQTTPRVTPSRGSGSTVRHQYPHDVHAAMDSPNGLSSPETAAAGSGGSPRWLGTGSFAQIVSIAQEDHLAELEAKNKQYRGVIRDLSAQLKHVQGQHGHLVEERDVFEQNVRYQLEEFYSEKFVQMSDEIRHLQTLIPPPPPEMNNAAIETDVLDSDYQQKLAVQRERHEVALHDAKMGFEERLLEQRKSYEDDIKQQLALRESKYLADKDIVESKQKSDASHHTQEKRALEETIASLRSSLLEAAQQHENQKEFHNKTKEEMEQRFQSLKASYDELLETFRQAEKTATEHMGKQRDELKSSREEMKATLEMSEQKWKELVKSETERCDEISCELQLVREDRTQLMAEQNKSLKAIESKLAASQVELTRINEEKRRAEELVRLEQIKCLELEKSIRVKTDHSGKMLASYSEEKVKLAERCAALEEKLETEQKTSAMLKSTLDEVRKGIEEARDERDAAQNLASDRSVEISKLQVQLAAVRGELQAEIKRSTLAAAAATIEQNSSSGSTRLIGSIGAASPSPPAVSPSRDPMVAAEAALSPPAAMRRLATTTVSPSSTTATSAAGTATTTAPPTVRGENNTHPPSSAGSSPLASLSPPSRTASTEATSRSASATVLPHQPQAALHQHQQYSEESDMTTPPPQQRHNASDGGRSTEKPAADDENIRLTPMQKHQQVWRRQQQEHQQISLMKMSELRALRAEGTRLAEKESSLLGALNTNNATSARRSSSAASSLQSPEQDHSAVQSSPNSTFHSPTMDWHPSKKGVAAASPNPPVSPSTAQSTTEAGSDADALASHQTQGPHREQSPAGEQLSGLATFLKLREERSNPGLAA